MAKTSGKNTFVKLLRNAARNRNRNYRRRRKLKATGPQQAGLKIDEEWRSRFARVRKRGQQPQARLIDAVHRYCVTFLETTKPPVRFRSMRNLYRSIK